MVVSDIAHQEKKSSDMSDWSLSHWPVMASPGMLGPQKEAGEIPGLDSNEAQRIPSWMVYLIQSLEEEEARRIALSG